MVRCPGQDQRFWKPEDIFEVKCPGCGGSVEFFKDEPKLKCRKCGQLVANPKIDLGCAEWCQYAEQCLGVSAGGELNIIQDKLIDEMKKVFVGDQKRIEHALSVLNYAEQIQAAEGGDPLVVKAAVILHDIGIPEAEHKYGSSAGKYQEIEGPPIARSIMIKLGAKEELIEEVCDIIGHHHHPRSEETINFKVLYDADLITNLEEKQKKNPTDKDRMSSIIDTSFLTDSGRKEGRKALLN